ncbi:MAG TPA: hypothetical protein VLV50_17325, partial [Stellaceae bacterium]|nr:hypothetical protein [Stellaceae bacterium]
MDTVNLRDHSLEEFDTPTLLAHASEQAAKRKYEDFCIVDVDSHHYESDSFTQILSYIEDPVMRADAKHMGMRDGGITSSRGSYQEMAGRVTRYKGRAKEKTPADGPHRDITLTRRWMDAFGVDFTCLFPTPMLSLGLTPRVEVEVALARAYNRWLIDNVTSKEPRIKASLYLPFNSPPECERMIEELGEKPGVVGFCVTAPRYKGVWDN